MRSAAIIAERQNFSKRLF